MNFNYQTFINKELREAMFRKRCAHNRAKKDHKNKEYGLR